MTIKFLGFIFGNKAKGNGNVASETMRDDSILRRLAEQTDQTQQWQMAADLNKLYQRLDHYNHGRGRDERAVLRITNASHNRILEALNESIRMPRHEIDTFPSSGANILGDENLYRQQGPQYLDGMSLVIGKQSRNVRYLATGHNGFCVMGDDGHYKRIGSFLDNHRPQQKTAPASVLRPRTA